MLGQCSTGLGRIVQEMGLIEQTTKRHRGAAADRGTRNPGGPIREPWSNRLARHAERVNYPAIAQGVRAIAAKEAEHEKTMRAILPERNLWPRPPAEVPHEGSNSWERLSNDLEILLLFARELHQHAMRWEGETPSWAKR